MNNSKIYDIIWKDTNKPGLIAFITNQSVDTAENHPYQRVDIDDHYSLLKLIPGLKIGAVYLHPRGGYFIIYTNGTVSVGRHDDRIGYLVKVDK